MNNFNYSQIYAENRRRYKDTKMNSEKIGPLQLG